MFYNKYAILSLSEENWLLKQHRKITLQHASKFQMVPGSGGDGSFTNTLTSSLEGVQGREHHRQSLEHPTLSAAGFEGSPIAELLGVLFFPPHNHSQSPRG